MLVVNLLKGNEHIESIIGIERFILYIKFRCSFYYWLIYATYIPFALLITIIGVKIIKDEYTYRLSIGYQYTRYDIVWTWRSFYIYPIFALISGILAGFVGIGGGLIIGPLLLELGMHPVVSLILI